MTSISINPAIVSAQTNLPKDICEIIRNHYAPRNGDEIVDADIRKWNDSCAEFDQEKDHNIRKTEIKWIPEHEWIAGMLQYYIDHINKSHFRYDISGGVSGNHFQYSVYRNGAHYDWHSDEGRNLFYLTTNHPNEMVRKLSFSLQLSDGDEYEGGELCFLGEDNKEELPQSKDLGTLIIFDSRMDHCVKPVTSGVRHALVGWYNGPIWR